MVYLHDYKLMRNVESRRLFTTATTAVTVNVTVAKPAAEVVAVPGNKKLSICSLNVIRLYPSDF